MSAQTEAEWSVLGAVLLNNEAYWRVCNKIRAEDFADPLNRDVFKAIGAQLAKGEPSDPVTLLDVAGDDVGMRAVELQRYTYSAANVMAYADIVQRTAEARRLRQAGDAISHAESYEAAQTILAGVRPTQNQRLKSATDGLREMVEAIQRRYDAGDAVSGVPTGLASLDELTGGWQAGDLIVLAARPSMGKTAFALQSAIAAGRSVFFSLEMTAGKLIERATAHLGNFPYRWIRFPLAPETPEYASHEVLKASQLVAVLPMLIDDSTGLSVDSICSRARQAHMADPLRLIIVDHLGLIDRPHKHDPSELGIITTQFKRLAKDLGVPVLLLCQLNRGLDQRNDKRPLLSDLRDSGRIEEDADIVIALHREEYHNANSPLKGYIECLIRKARDGELGTAWGLSRLANMRIETCAAPEIEPTGTTGGNNGNRGFAARSGQGRETPQVSGTR